MREDTEVFAPDPVEHIDDFLERPLHKPQFLVDQIWTQGAVGIIAGQAKGFKTALTTDLGFSVASGTKFLAWPTMIPTAPCVHI